MSKSDFANKEYRDEFVRSFVSGAIATQLKMLRERRGLTQEQLAHLAGMKQSRISAMENVNYSRWNIKTLQRLAQALDLALVVRFESFGAVLKEADSTSPQALARPSYAEDPEFSTQVENAPSVPSAVSRR